MLSFLLSFVQNLYSSVRNELRNRAARRHIANFISGDDSAVAAAYEDFRRAYERKDGKMHIFTRKYVDDDGDDAIAKHDKFFKSLVLSVDTRNLMAVSLIGTATMVTPSLIVFMNKRDPKDNKVYFHYAITPSRVHARYWIKQGRSAQEIKQRYNVEEAE